MWSSKHSVFKLADLITEHLPILAEVSALVFYHLRDFPTKRSCTFVYGERRKQYPKNWEYLAWQCKEQAGWKCKSCHIKHGAKRKSRRTGERYTVYLHAAHRNHDIGNATPDLLCLCPTCHGKFDYRHRRSKQQINLERVKHRMLLRARAMQLQQ